jgi:hypothetical protein
MNIADRFGKTGHDSKRAGLDWLVGFLLRHPTISTRSTEMLSYGRGTGLNKAVVNQFYCLLDETIQDKKIKPCSKVTHFI